MKNKNTNFTLIFSVALLIAVIAGFFYFLRIIRNKNKHISAVTTTLSQKMSELENIKALEKRVSELGNTNKKIDNYLVDTSNIDTFVSFFENMGTSNNVSLSVKSVEVVKNEKNKLSVTVSMSGDFSNITKVIALIENAPYSINISSMSMNNVTENNTNTTTDTSGKTVTPPPVKSSWHAEITFTVLTI